MTEPMHQRVVTVFEARAPYFAVALSNLAVVLWLSTGEQFDLQRWARFTAQIAALTLGCVFILPLLKNRRAVASGLPKYTNRRALGLAYAMAMLIHACALIFYHWVTETDVRPLTLFIGSFAYLTLLLMVLTSFQRFRSQLSGRSWKVLHRFGLSVCVLITALTSAGGVVERGWISVSSIVLLLLLLGFVARIVAATAIRAR